MTIRRLALLFAALIAPCVAAAEEERAARVVESWRAWVEDAGVRQQIEDQRQVTEVGGELVRDDAAARGPQPPATARRQRGPCRAGCAQRRKYRLQSLEGFSF